MDALDLTDAAEARCEALGLDFLARFFEVELDRRPENLDALAELGHVYTRLGRFLDGLAVDRRLAEARPEDSGVQYNLACSLALTGDRDGAFRALERAVELGYDDATFLTEDPDLAALRGDPRFAAVVRAVTERAGGA